MARLELDDGFHLLAPLRVGHADDGDVVHGRMRQQHGIGLGRIDVHSTRDDEVGAPIGEEQIAVGIHVTHVADRKVVTAKRCFGLLGVLVVGEADGRRRLQIDGTDRIRR